MKGDISVRNLDQKIIAGLDDLARKRNISREEFIRRLCKKAVEAEELHRIENRYETTLRRMEDIFFNALQVVERNTLVLEDVLDQIRNS